MAFGDFVRAISTQTGNGAASSAASFASLPAVNNVVVIVCSLWNRNLAAGEVTDNQSNTYLKDAGIGPIDGAGDTGEDSVVAIFSDVSIGSPSGTFTITVNPGGGADYFQWAAAEFEGPGVLDIVATNSGDGAVDTTPDVTGGTTTAGAFWVGVLGIDDADGGTASAEIDAAAGWTTLGTIVQDPGTVIAFYGAYKSGVASGALTFNGGTLRAALDGWTIAAASYKAAAAADNAYRVQPGVIIQAVQRGAFF